MNSIASNSPIVRELILRVISSGEIEVEGEKHRIDNNLVPSISNKTHIISRGFQESIMNSNQKKFEQVPQNRVSPITNSTPKVILEGYGRLAGLIKDGSISSIEYLGEGNALKITKFGRQQNTNIILSQEEIKSILDYVSGRTRIPVANKVFRVVIDNLLFNAVISPEIGTRFFIKKNFQISPDYKEAKSDGIQR